MYEVTQNLADRAYRYIKQEMQQGSLVPGSQLVNRKLAAEIGVSVIPVREAIHRLVSEGLVEHVPGAAAEASRYITPHQLDDLDAMLDEFAEIRDLIRERSDGHATPAQFHRWLDLEEAFHETVIDASRNRLIAKVIREHRAVSTVFESQRNSSKILTVDLAEKTCDSKKELLQALRDGNGPLAREVMSAQIQRGCRDVLAFLRQERRS